MPPKSTLNSSGMCQCGCGERTRLAPFTKSEYGWVKGEPIRFINRHANRVPIAERIQRYEVDPASSCWIWQGSTDKRSGYGRIGFRGKLALVHRISYELHKGPIPVGLELDHLCRNRRCINPDHLEPVTRRENVARGSSRKLTDEMIRFIRDNSQAMSNGAIARQLGISRRSVQLVLNGKRWQHIA